jgi:hypothetical protein
MRLDRAYLRQERIIADADKDFANDLERRAIITDRATRAQIRILQREARLLKLDRQDAAESIGKDSGSSLSERLRTMSNEELARELAAYRQGVDDARGLTE